MRRWNLPAFALAASFGLLPASAVRAHEPDAYGLGSRATALGGAVAADAADFSGNYYNPAALVSAPGVSISVGYVYVWNQLRINDQDNGVADVHGVAFGLVAPGTILGLPFAFGIGTYLPDAGLSRIKALRQETPRWALYDERASILFLAANLAIRPFRWLELGGGVAFLAATKGRFGISGSADILHPYDSELRHEVDADLTSVRYPELGVRVKLDGFGCLALVYRGQSQLKLDLAAQLQGNIDFAGIEVPLRYDLESRTVSAFLPQQLVLGASFTRVRRLKVNVDFTFVNWAAYESPTAQTRAHLDVDLEEGLPVTLPADPKPTKVIPPAFADRLVPRVGVEYLVPAGGALRAVRGHTDKKPLIEIPLRAGYVYERSPVPPQVGVTNFVDTDRHTLSLGAGITLNAPIALLPGSLHGDVHAAVSILPERVTYKNNPADFIGDYRASGSMVGLGATLSAEF